MSLTALIVPVLFLILAAVFPASIKAAAYLLVVGVAAFLVAFALASGSTGIPDGALRDALLFRDVPIEANGIFRFVQTGYGFCVASIVMFAKAILSNNSDEISKD